MGSNCIYEEERWNSRRDHEMVFVIIRKWRTDTHIIKIMIFLRMPVKKLGKLKMGECQLKYLESLKMNTTISVPSVRAESNDGKYKTPPP